MTVENLVKKYRQIFKDTPKVETAHLENKGHFYVSPTTKEKYHSVTYFTSFIKDPSLANWRMNRALEHIRAEWGNGLVLNIDEVIEKAKSAPEGQFQLAGDIGKMTHAWREEWFRNWIDSGKLEAPKDPPYPSGLNPEVISGCRAIKKFLKETGAIPVACELALVDDELRVGGTIDDLMVFPNKQIISVTSDPIKPEDLQPGKVINLDWQKGGFKTSFKPYLGFVDLKTSNQGKKPSYAFQVRGFYQRMIRKTFKVRPKKTYILHTSKADGTYKLIDLTEMTFLEKDAKDLVRLSQSWDKVVEEFKPKQIVI